MLMRWSFERADKEGVVSYLDTEADGKVIALYEKLGFVKVDEVEISFQCCGLQSNLHVRCYDSGIQGHSPQ